MCMHAQYNKIIQTKIQALITTSFMIWVISSTGCSLMLSLNGKNGLENDRWSQMIIILFNKQTS